MKQETKQPLYKVLNEQRTQGDYYISDIPQDDGEFMYSELDKFSAIARFYTKNDVGKKAKANAEYTTLSVNNLHHLAEALGAFADLERSLKEALKGHELLWAEYVSPAIKQAKEALNRISK